MGRAGGDEKSIKAKKIIDALLSKAKAKAIADNPKLGKHLLLLTQLQSEKNNTRLTFNHKIQILTYNLAFVQARLIENQSQLSSLEKTLVLLNKARKN